MKVLKPRSRTISVRLSEDEYEALRHLCSVTGARSVSDLTRDAVNSLLRGVNSEIAPARQLDEYRAGIRNMERRVAQLEASINRIKAGAAR
jgi:predicted DNA-binding protein